MIVTAAEHAAWHKKHGGCGCGSGKEHTARMKKWGIAIKKKRSIKRKK